MAFGVTAGVIDRSSNAAIAWGEVVLKNAMTLAAGGLAGAALTAL